MFAGVDGGPRCFDGDVDHAAQRDARAAYLEATARNSRNIEQVVEQARHVRGLSLDHRVTPANLLGRRVRMGRERRGLANGRQRIAQFVREGGEEFILPAVRELQRVPGGALLGGIAEHQHHAGDDARVVADRRTAVLDRGFMARLVNQHRVIREPDDASFAQHLGHRAFHRLARLLVDDAEYLFERFAPGIAPGASR